MKYKPLCVKCRSQYDSDEPDDYYCPPCLEEKKALEIEVDKKMKAKKRPNKVASDWDVIQKGGEIRHGNAVIFSPMSRGMRPNNPNG